MGSLTHYEFNAIDKILSGKEPKSFYTKKEKLDLIKRYIDNLGERMEGCRSRGYYYDEMQDSSRRAFAKIKELKAQINFEEKFG